MTLESRFHEEMLGLYDQSAEVNYHPTYFRRMVLEQGGLAAAKSLLNAPEISDGFTTLWNKGRLDLSVEAVALRYEWRVLFSAKELLTAKQRLVDARYDGPELRQRPNLTPPQ